MSWKLVAIVLSLVGVVEAQSVRGVIGGVVKDSSGAAVNGAAVTLTNDETGEQRKSKADGNGEFTFALVAPGSLHD